VTNAPLPLLADVPDSSTDSRPTRGLDLSFWISKLAGCAINGSSASRSRCCCAALACYLTVSLSFACSPLSGEAFTQIQETLDFWTSLVSDAAAPLCGSPAIETGRQPFCCCVHCGADIRAVCAIRWAGRAAGGQHGGRLVGAAAAPGGGVGRRTGALCARGAHGTAEAGTARGAIHRLVPVCSCALLSFFLAHFVLVLPLRAVAPQAEPLPSVCLACFL
jgi:hypothetical protein